MLGKHTCGTDAGVDGESQTGDWRNIGILFAYVENFSIQALAMRDSHSWAISLERCAHGHLRDLQFASTEYKTVDGTRERILNQDGVDLRMGCHDILIENISGYTGDDLIALTAIPRDDQPAGDTTATMVSEDANRGEGQDDIRHIIIRNIKGYSRGGHHIVRLLNTPGLRLHDVVLDGLIDTAPKQVRCKAAVKIGDHNYGGGVARLGDTSRIIINNVISQAQHAILVGGSLADSSISNVIRRQADGHPITYIQGEAMSRNVMLSNLMNVTK